MGAITSSSAYAFYSQYIIRFECERFHGGIIRLALAFLAALTPPLRVDFANNFQYSLFKQGEQVKALVCSVAALKDHQPHHPQRATNFNILAELNDQRASRLTFSTKHKEQEFLVGLFRLLGQVEAASTTHKDILGQLGYAVVVGVAVRYSGEMLVRHELLRFLLASVEKRVRYGLNKYLKGEGA